LPVASFTVTVSVVVATPLAVTELGLAAADEVVLLGEPTVNVTGVVGAAPPWLP